MTTTALADPEDDGPLAEGVEEYVDPVEVPATRASRETVEARIEALLQRVEAPNRAAVNEQVAKLREQLDALD